MLIRARSSGVKGKSSMKTWVRFEVTFKPSVCNSWQRTDTDIHARLNTVLMTG